MPSSRLISTFSRRGLSRAGTAMALMLMLSACGYKGPLYMPPPPPPEPDASLTTPPTSSQLDAPTTTGAP